MPRRVFSSLVPTDKMHFFKIAKKLKKYNIFVKFYERMVISIEKHIYYANFCL